MIPYLRLVRLPNVFSALSNIIGAWLILRANGYTPDVAALAKLTGASAALYLSGMAFNDLADREEDARVRPNRPIPSGAVSLSGAWTCAFGLMALGLGLTAWNGLPSLYVALALSLAILGYDFVAKRGRWTGVAMLGVCRFLNVSLGLSAAFAALPNAQDFASKPFLWAAPCCIGFYAAGITAFSAQEEGGRRDRAIIIGWVCIALGMGLAASQAPLALAFFVPLAAWLARCSVVLIKTKTPLAARDLVRSAVMGVCVVDAGLVLGFKGLPGLKYAAVLAVLWIPGMLLGKWLAQKEA